MASRSPVAIALLLAALAVSCAAIDGLDAYRTCTGCADGGTGKDRRLPDGGADSERADAAGGIDAGAALPEASSEASSSSDDGAAEATEPVDGAGPEAGHDGATDASVETGPAAPLSKGKACGSAADCQSGFCVDGVCCDGSCGGGAVDCEACSRAAGASVDGTCAVLAPGAVCRPAAGACDVAETCSGSSSACPADAFVAAATLCSGPQSVCSSVAVCPGNAAACPATYAPVDADCAYGPVFSVYTGGAPGANASDLTSGYVSQSLTGGVAGTAGWSNVLRFTAKSGFSSGNLFDYWTFSTAQYVVRAGDYVEYDVSLPQSSVGLGGIDVLDNSSPTYWRDVGWSDQNGLVGHPATDLSSKATGTWYHRRLAVPPSRVGATIVRWDVADESDATNTALTAYYDDVVVTQIPGGCNAAGVCKIKSGGACVSGADCATGVCTASVCSH